MISIYPFTAIVGQDDMCLALILNAINPAIGGVLIRGEKGTGKSTAVRALAKLLPLVETAVDCPHPFAPSDLPNDLWPHTAIGVTSRPAPLVNLPLGVTEDRLLGTLDLESALQKGEKRFDAGLLAQAHQGVLYIDEVNLLSDHVVDVLLDVAAMGTNMVEREGISVQHPARFMLVGTMNPEEGDLRPQLLDRFGLAVEVAGSKKAQERAEIVRRRLAFDQNNDTFAARFTADEEALRQKIALAQSRLPQVILADDLFDLIAHICLSFEVDGMRADLVIHKTARTLAAWSDRLETTEEDVRQAAELALLHRRRRQPFDEPQLDQQKLDDALEQHRQEQEREQSQSPENNLDDMEGD